VAQIFAIRVKVCQAVTVTQVRRVARFRVDSYERIGERLRVDGHLARTGIQIYDDGFGNKRSEYRPPEEVFDEASLNSFKGIPITIGHPSEGLVTPKNWSDLAVGHVGDDVRRSDDGSHVAATIWLHDDRAIQRVEKKELVELSAGYLAVLDETPGTTPEGERYDARQTQIAANHVALLEQGQARGGPTVRLLLDSKGHAIMDSDPPSRGDFRKDGLMKITLRIDGKSYPVDAENDDVVEAFEALVTDHNAQVKAKNDEIGAIKAKLDEAEDKARDLKAKLDEATDPVKIAAVAEARAKLVADAREIGGKDLKAEGTEHEIRLAALEGAGVKLDAEDAKSEAYVRARFDARLEAISKEDRARDELYDSRRSAAGNFSGRDHRSDQKPAFRGVDLDRGYQGAN